jgi:hypothetical protein
VLAALALVVAAALLAVGRDDPEPRSDAARGRRLFTAKFTPPAGAGPPVQRPVVRGLPLRADPRRGGPRRPRDGAAGGAAHPSGFEATVGGGGPIAPQHAISELGAACHRQAGIPAGVNVTSVRNAPPCSAAG